MGTDPSNFEGWGGGGLLHKVRMLLQWDPEARGAGGFITLTPCVPRYGKQKPAFKKVGWRQVSPLLLFLSLSLASSFYSGTFLVASTPRKGEAEKVREKDGGRGKQGREKKKEDRISR